MKAIKVVSGVVQYVVLNCDEMFTIDSQSWLHVVVKTVGNNSKLTIISFKVLMFLHLLFSLKCVVPPQMKT
jgi:hypothetical protein